MPDVIIRSVTLRSGWQSLRQIEGELSPGLTEREEPGPDDEKRGVPGPIEPGNAFFSASVGDLG